MLLGAATGSQFKSLVLSTTSDNIEMSNANFGAYDHSLFAVSVWVKKTAGSGYTVISQATGTEATSAFEINITTQLVISTYHGGSRNDFVGTTTTFANDTWYHILVHLDPTNGTAADRIKVWVNGSAESSTGTRSNSSSVNSATCNIGIGTTDLAVSSNWTGKIYQPALFSGSLPVIGSLYSSGQIKDITGVTGLYSLISPRHNTSTDDYVLSANWTNNGTISLSTDIPS